MAKQNPEWFTEQEKIPSWLSVALMFRTEPYHKWNEEKQKLGEELTEGIKQYAESYGWSEEIKKKLFTPKHPEDNRRYYMGD